VNRTRRTTGLRELLIAADDARREEWRRGPHHPCWDGADWELPVDDGDRALRAGEPVVLFSDELRGALRFGGLDWRPYARGGPEDGKRWLLDENDRLTEWKPDA